MKGFGEQIHTNKEKLQKIQIDEKTNLLIKKAFELQAQGKKLEAAKYYVHLINSGIKDYRVFKFRYVLK